MHSQNAHTRTVKTRKDKKNQERTGQDKRGEKWTGQTRDKTRQNTTPHYTPPHNTIHRKILQYNTRQYITQQCTNTLQYTTPHCTALHCTTRYNNTAQRNTTEGQHTLTFTRKFFVFLCPGLRYRNQIFSNFQTETTHELPDGTELHSAPNGSVEPNFCSSQVSLTKKHIHNGKFIQGEDRLFSSRNLVTLTTERLCCPEVLFKSCFIGQCSNDFPMVPPLFDVRNVSGFFLVPGLLASPAGIFISSSYCRIELD